MLGLEIWPYPLGLSRPKFGGLSLEGSGLGLEGPGVGSECFGIEGPGFVNIPDEEALYGSRTPDWGAFRGSLVDSKPTI